MSSLTKTIVKMPNVQKFMKLSRSMTIPPSNTAMTKMKGLEIFHYDNLGNDDLLGISYKYGVKLEEAPVQERGRTVVEGYPHIYIVSNALDKTTGIPIGSLGSGEAVWHTDMSYLPIPPTHSLLYAVNVPKVGGDTWFCDMIHAWKTLPENIASQIVHKRIYHDAKYNSGGMLRAEGTEGMLHPAVIRLDNGESALYLGRRRGSHIEGLPHDQSEILLDIIWAYVTGSSTSGNNSGDSSTVRNSNTSSGGSTSNTSSGSGIYQHHWRVGDLLVWDNRSTMHRRDAFDNTDIRIMYRTQVLGSVPLVSGVEQD